eukprot:4439819-Pyramimonas_sp.AAC.1
MKARTLWHAQAMWLPQTATQLTRLKLGSGIAPTTSSRLPTARANPESSRDGITVTQRCQLGQL